MMSTARAHGSLGPWIAAFLLSLLAACGGGSDESAVPAFDDVVAGIDVSPMTSELDAQSTVQLDATARNEAGEAIPNVSFEWQSSDPDVATIDASGLVTAISQGSATITASVADVTSEPAEITVRAPEDFVPAVMDLPIVRIETEDRAPVVSKDDYLRATLTIDPNGTLEEAISVPLRIRGRGNTTWGMPKKPYKLKLDDKASLLRLPAHKDWVLLANYADKSLLRTSVAFELGKRVGLAWTPRFKSVALFINDDYLGTYQLGESIKPGEHRLDMHELEEDEILAPEVTGDYLLEVDAYLGGDANFTTSRNVIFVIDTPEAPPPEQFEYIEHYIQQTEDAIYCDENAACDDRTDPVTGYNAYIDVDSFINWYLVNELTRNNDAILYKSVWMYKRREGKLHVGPLWDFDISSGNVTFNGNDDPEGWWVRWGVWFKPLFEDPEFEARVRDRWNELKAGQIDTILDYIDDSAAALEQGAANNFRRWPILDEWVWPNAVVAGSYEGEVQYLRDWLEARIAWMDAEFNGT